MGIWAADAPMPPPGPVAYISLNCATIEDDEGGTGTGAATKGGILFIVLMCLNNSAIPNQLNILSNPQKENILVT